MECTISVGQVRYWNIPMVTGGAMASDFGTFKKANYALLTRVGPNFNSLSEFITSTLLWFRSVLICHLSYSITS